jgi:hypothetical protein
LLGETLPAHCDDHDIASELEPERRFELLTCALRVRCSTD